MRFERVILIILDGFGVGELPDAGLYGDKGANTLLHTAEAAGGLDCPNLESLGLGNVVEARGLRAVKKPGAAYGKMLELSAGKDTTTGHWEMMGLVLLKPFPTFPNGFPAEFINNFETAIGRRVLGNVSASGTEIINKLGEEHLKSGRPIVYTSADSVFQIAAHEEVIPIKELYRICESARNMLKGKMAVGRVIARPFEGKQGSYIRTRRRKDYSLEPPGKTALDYMNAGGIKVTGIGKIKEIFAGKGINRSYHIGCNNEGLTQTLREFKLARRGFIFTNLVDFDMLWGHRNDAAGFAGGLKEIDEFLPKILSALKKNDILFLSADHGCDPGFPGTDHTREYVPLLACSPGIKKGVGLGIRKGFCDLGKTILDLFGIENELKGISFANLLEAEKKTE